MRPSGGPGRRHRFGPGDPIRTAPRRPVGARGYVSWARRRANAHQWDATEPVTARPMNGKCRTRPAPRLQENSTITRHQRRCSTTSGPKAGSINRHCPVSTPRRFKTSTSTIGSSSAMRFVMGRGVASSSTGPRSRSLARWQPIEIPHPQFRVQGVISGT